MKAVLRSALKPVSAAADRFQPSPPGVTVLIYHRVGGRPDGGEVDLEPVMFADQMTALAETGRVVDLDTALAAMADGSATETRPIVITFDDGTPDVFDTALPILADHDLPMTLYLATASVEQGVGFWTPEDAALTWAAIADGLSTGLVTIGSHTHNHALLDRLAPEELADELDRSVDLIGEHLQVRADHFAYPKALTPSAAADAAVRARFTSAALAGTRTNPAGHDPFRLWRSPVQRSDAMRWFLRKVDGGMGFEDRVRERLNRRRYADASR